ncbi:hypothetical protein QVD17_08796 [Tagetes erecta]|uniref:Ubiquitin-like protease family profile domain-containing protein n=1 Tax=Tagetes erecta TaxID=13708 RepID=A0AAD8L665_TARER|nr:hypothetical protein QVD17_08796 [Tagetes erecta]
MAQLDLKFYRYHNTCACFVKTSKNSEFHPIIDFIERSPIHLAVSVNPQICEEHIRDFWASARVGDDGISATVAGHDIIITKLMISDTFEFDDLECVESYSEGRIKICMEMMDYNTEPIEKQYRKNVFYPLWRYLAHVILRCISCRRQNFDSLCQRLASMMVALTFCQEFSYSSYIYDELRIQIQSETKFLMFPRFLQYIFNKNLPNLVHVENSLKLSHMKLKVFSNLSREPGTGVDVPLFPHMLDLDEVPLFPDAAEEEPADELPDAAAEEEPAAEEEDAEKQFASRILSMTHSQLVSFILDNRKKFVDASVQTDIEEEEEVHHRKKAKRVLSTSTDIEEEEVHCRFVDRFVDDSENKFEKSKFGVSKFYSRKKAKTVLSTSTEDSLKAKTVLSTSTEDSFIYPSFDDPNGIHVYARHIAQLEPGNWLSDVIIDFYIRSHWSLIIICMPSEDDELIILHLDSLNLHNSRSILKDIEWFIMEEYQHLGIVCQSQIVHKLIQVPQQTNDSDCGVFILLYIENFMKQAPERLKMHHLSMFSENWFGPEEASNLRTRIKSILEKLFQKATGSTRHREKHERGTRKSIRRRKKPDIYTPSMK